MSPYHYTECGLDHVMINGVQFIQDDAGESVTTIPNIDGLHRAIATGIVSKSGNLTGKELRFLRTEMGMTQAELAAISRWERGETELIDANAETLIRLFAKEKLNLEIDVTVEDMSQKSVQSALSLEIEIDGSNTDDYRPMVYAA
jgi:DNA-binding transcriptional regulator YiaG